MEYARLHGISGLIVGVESLMVEEARHGAKWTFPQLLSRRRQFFREALRSERSVSISLPVYSVPEYGSVGIHSILVI